MKIVNHWLQSTALDERIIIKETKNVHNIIDPDYLILHYTADDKPSQSINWFLNINDNTEAVAAHIVIDQQGEITQLVPFNRRANHAGSSTWDGVERMNTYAIGIELVNPGYVQKMANGTFRRMFNGKWISYSSNKAVDIIAARHKHNNWSAKDYHYWFTFPKAQLESLYKLSRLLIAHYNLVRAIGHDDVSAFRKPDPGPAFPWAEFKQKVMNSNDHVGEVFQVKQNIAEFRAGASTNAALIKNLTKGFEVGLIETNGEWNKVYLCNSPSDVLFKDRKTGIVRCIKTIGWIHSSFLQPKPI